MPSMKSGAVWNLYAMAVFLKVGNLYKKVHKKILKS